MSDLPHTARVQKGWAAIDIKFTTTPRSTTSGQHLWSIASLSTAGKYQSHMKNVGKNVVHGKSDIYGSLMLQMQ